jgi:cell division septum initiation protein DivIVA
MTTSPEATDEMSEHQDLLPNPTQEDPFEVQMRGYSRRQVDEFVARSRNQSRDLEERLARSLDDVERLRLELSSARQAASGGKPAHEEVSERIAQILKLASDEATAQKTVANDEITKQRADAQKAADNTRAEAKGQAERMLAAAQEQAERAIAAARSEAEKVRTTARAEAERMGADSRKNAEATTTTAKAQAKQLLDEANARATAIHDGADRRLDLLKNRHSEAMRRLTEIRDVVTDLVAHDAAKGSLDEEVDKAIAVTLGGPPKTGKAGSSGNGTAAAKPKPPATQSAPVPASPASAAQSAPAGASSVPSPASLQHARHAAAAQPMTEDRPLRQAKPSQGSLDSVTSSAEIPEASPEDVRVIMP